MDQFGSLSKTRTTDSSETIKQAQQAERYFLTLLELGQTSK